MLSGNASRYISVHEIFNKEPLLGMTSTSYCYGQLEPSDDKDDCHIDRVAVEEEVDMLI
jgi:hypothetical protein